MVITTLVSADELHTRHSSRLLLVLTELSRGKMID